MVLAAVAAAETPGRASFLYDEELKSSDDEEFFAGTRPTFQSLGAEPDVGVNVPHNKVTDEENESDGVPDGKSGSATASPKSGRIEAATEAPANAAFQLSRQTFDRIRLGIGLGRQGQEEGLWQWLRLRLRQGQEEGIWQRQRQRQRQGQEEERHYPALGGG